MKEPKDHLQINLWGDAEQSLHLNRVKEGMRRDGIRHALICDNSDILYLTGRVFRGFIYINVDMERPLYFLRMPNHLKGEGITMIHRPEDIVPVLAEAGVDVSECPALELDAISWSRVRRVAKAFGFTGNPQNVYPAMRHARAAKTEAEQALVKASGVKQSLVYERIPHMYQEGMSDIELQIEIERGLRLEGDLGIFRVSGGEMEIFMGNVLTGENADTPSPYDFAMGGEGISPALPGGANGTVIKPGLPVMVDMNSNFNGYMTDMTRCYVVDEPVELAVRVNKLSIDICNALSDMMAPGVEAKALYEKALAMATEAGMEQFFMGHRHHAGFVGHGIGIEVNELPVLAPRSRDILEDGNVIAVEPKFVIPGMGAVGVENTYIVHAGRHAELVTTARMDITMLD